MKTTSEYFGMTNEELLKIRNEHGYTREDCKLLDDGLKVSFYDTEKGYKEMIEENNEWYKDNFNYEVKATLKMASGQIAVVYN